MNKATRKWQGPSDESDAMYDEWRTGGDGDPLPRLALADWLEENGNPEWSAHLRAGAPIPPSIEDGDWGYAFAYAGEVGGDGTPTIDSAPPGDMAISIRPFTRRDVKTVLAISEGENDGANWLCAGILWDGRFFYLSAGCDYTGWG